MWGSTRQLQPFLTDPVELSGKLYSDFCPHYRKWLNWNKEILAAKYLVTFPFHWIFWLENNGIRTPQSLKTWGYQFLTSFSPLFLLPLADKNFSGSLKTWMLNYLSMKNSINAIWRASYLSMNTELHLTKNNQSHQPSTFLLKYTFFISITLISISRLKSCKNLGIA